ncbi:MAG: 2Fe-2S iron-sulfur cluster-binding protein, partial [Acidimicrobiales bacterium]
MAGTVSTDVTVGTGLTAFRLNGSEVRVDSDHPHLLSALREELDVTSPKDGCSPTGQCGCCTVLLDGKAVVACQLSLSRVAGREVTTLEGFDGDERRRYAEAFAATGALQCGFCTPGIIVRAKALLDKRGPELSRDDAARHLGAHLCRCTGYVKILDAIEILAAGSEQAAGGEPAAGSEPAANPGARLPRGLGRRGARYEAVPLALGDRGYVDDIRLPGMLHAALRLADHARAEVVSVDTRRALAAPGVEAVLTAEDVPGELRVGLINRDWPVMIPAGGTTSYLGDVIAVVVATDRRSARAAAELVEVGYRVLRPLTDPVAALDDPEDAVWG